jgi:hypothetical protein
MLRSHNRLLAGFLAITMTLTTLIQAGPIFAEDAAQQAPPDN